MAENNLLEKIRREGFENISDFIEANLHYLPENKQKLFCSIKKLSKLYPYLKTSKEYNYIGKNYCGKS